MLAPDEVHQCFKLSRGPRLDHSLGMGMTAKMEYLWKSYAASSACVTLPRTRLSRAVQPIH